MTRQPEESACGCSPVSPLNAQTTEHSAPEIVPWWRQSSLIIPIAAGITLVAGLIIPWSPLVWISLILGGSQFMPGATVRLIRKRKLGIGLLMTLSAIGAVLLGHVEEAAALAFLFSIVEALEDRAMIRARASLHSLLSLIPASVRIIDAKGISHSIAAHAITPGIILRLRAGERVATDGVVVSGESTVDLSAVTGESIPVFVHSGSDIPAGAIVISGGLDIQATAPGSDNSLTAAVKLVEQAQQEKGQRARIADRLARPLIPGVLILALLVALIGVFSNNPELWIERALVVLVAASPCALAISVPITVLSATASAGRFGMIITSGAAFERLGKIKHVAFDKTGTLTRNQPSVVATRTVSSVLATEVLQLAGAVEAHSTHPLANAIVDASNSVLSATEIREIAGSGISGRVDQARIKVGNPRWLDPGRLAPDVAELEQLGITVVVVQRDSKVIGVIGVRDELRSDAEAVITSLSDRGIGVSMLTGDNERTAAAIAEQAGITDVRAELKPGEKAAALAELSAQHSRSVAMLGDGINDAPALAAADVGIAVGIKASDAAINAADIAFTRDDLTLLPRVIDHAQRGMSIITQNIILSLAIIIFLLPLAISGVLGLTAVVLIHEIAEVFVILNGLRAARVPSVVD